MDGCFGNKTNIIDGMLLVEFVEAFTHVHYTSVRRRSHVVVTLVDGFSKELNAL